MRILLRAAIAAVSFASIGPANAGKIEGTLANTLFAERPGVMAQAPARKGPSIATARNGQAVSTYMTRSS